MTQAFVFPGQGSQNRGMLADFADADIVRHTFEEASEVLGYDLWALVQEDPNNKLGATDRTQPALLTASVAIWRLWEARGGKAPAYLAGHSLGEYSALCCAGALTLPAAVRLVEKRGQFMQTAVPAGTGGMAAVLGLADDKVVAACEQAAEGEVVAAVNFNAPGQVVIAGSRAALDRAMAACKEAGAKRALPLPVSVPSHCDLMKPAADKLADIFKETELATPAIPVINNVDVTVETEPSRIREALVRQLYQPVRWVETVQKLQAEGVDEVFECGAGKVLTGLMKRIDRDLPCHPLATAAAFDKALEG